MNLTRNELISICESGVVPCEDWQDRDSFSTQVQLSDIYGLLCAGAEYTAKVDEYGETIWIDFPNLPENFGTVVSQQLHHDDREDYFALDWVDDDDEMFIGNGLGYNDYDYKVGDRVGGYMPTRKRLEDTMDSRGDWY